MPKASNGMARLHEAWNIGDKHAFEAALAVFEQQSGPSETDKNGRTALWLAASIGSVKAIELLLRSGSVIESRCPNQPDSHGQTPLMLACVGASLEIAKSLIDFTPLLIFTRDDRTDDELRPSTHRLS